MTLVLFKGLYLAVYFVYSFGLCCFELLVWVGFVIVAIWFVFADLGCILGVLVGF